MTATRETISLIQPDDWHLHLRDGQGMKDVVAHSARQFARAIVMPNLKPPIVDTAQAGAYRQRILDALPAGSDFEPLMTLYLTDHTRPAEIDRARQSGFIPALKLYPAGATTNSDSGVTDLKKTYPALEAMQRLGMVLCIHGEVTDPAIDLFDREKAFIDDQLIPLGRDFPELKIVFEHITTTDAADYVIEAGPNVAATITAHHLLYNRNALFLGGIRPHYYCLPVLKREIHRQALVQAATSGNPKFFLGTDSAPHPQEEKESDCGCAGCYTALHAMELYAQAFDQAGRMDALEGFASLFGPAFYGLPANQRRITLERKAWTVPRTLKFAAGQLVPLAAAESLDWRLIDC
ncbi:MAG: dihydroorotase [Pseudomonadales bacterium]|nr:dihydroorotase [Pseudomonadales bacterium]